MSVDPKIVIAIIGAVVTVFGVWWAFHLRHTAEVRKEFRAAILKEFQGLYPHPVDWPKSPGIEHRLKECFPRLQVAVAAYRPFVWRKKAFDEAWRQYYCPYEWALGEQSYHHYMNFTGTKGTLDGPVTEVTNAKANFKANVDRLLSFTGG